MRLRPDGVRDRGAWSDGLATPELGRANAHAIVEIDGGFAVSGATNLRTSWGLTVSDGYIARIDELSGSLDRRFGHDGVTTTDFNRDGALATESATRTLLRQADGKLVMAGGTQFVEGWDVWRELTVARIDPGDGGHAGFAGLVEPIVWVDTQATAVFTVRRTGGSSGTLLVDFETVHGSAVAPRDYTHTRGTLTWADRDVEPKTIEVPITEGAVPAVPQYEKRFDVLLSTSSGSLARDRAWACLGRSCNEVGTNPNIASSGAIVSGSGASALPSGTAIISGGGGGGAAGIETLLLLVAAWLSSRRRQGTFRRCMNDA
jgi:hypothetical protein